MVHLLEIKLAFPSPRDVGGLQMHLMHQHQQHEGLLTFVYIVYIFWEHQLNFLFDYCICLFVV